MGVGVALAEPPEPKLNPPGAGEELVAGAIANEDCALGFPNVNPCGADWPVVGVGFPGCDWAAKLKSPPPWAIEVGSIEVG